MLKLQLLLVQVSDKSLASQTEMAGVPGQCLDSGASLSLTLVLFYA